MTEHQGQQKDKGQTGADTWDPAQYDKFQREREQPFFDLLAMVRSRPGMRVVDLGCGTGKLTRLLHAQLDARETLGIDRSDSMLAGIRDGALPAGLRFEVGTIEGFIGRGEAQQPEANGGDRWDLIFSNAALHWVDDHEQLLEQLVRRIAPSGQIAFQVPAQHDTLTHRLADELATAEPFRSAFAGWRRSQPVLTPDAYARLLYRCGFPDPKVQLIVYPHILASREDVVEWVKGTMLTEYKRHLPADVYDRFVDQYRQRLLATLEDARPFFYPFKRILCWGQRSSREADNTRDA
jgi:trans-aconitate 2-methyltransferase